jgi:ADP-ribose pyrophosphatase YjhB (NUDIX family)
MIEQKTPLVGVGLLLKDTEDKYLIMRRYDSNNQVCSAFPGGHVEVESIQHAAKREGKEELDIDITSTSVVATTEDIRENRLRYITFYLRCMYKGIPKNMEPEKCVELLWCHLYEIPMPYFIPLSNFLNSRARMEINGWKVSANGVVYNNRS